MSSYGRSQQAGYGQVRQADEGPRSYGQGAYGQHSPYDQQDAQLTQEGGYGNSQPYSTRPEPQQHGSSNYGDATAGGYEMGAINGQASRSQDENAILNECRKLGRDVDNLEENFNKLKSYIDKAKTQSNDKEVTIEFNSLSDSMKGLYRQYLSRYRVIKSYPESNTSRNKPHIERAYGKVQQAIRRLNKLNSDLQATKKEKIVRELRTCYPDAPPEEIQEMAESSSDEGVFRQTLLQGDRRGQAMTTQQNVRTRHQEIQKIESTIVELAQMFQDLATEVAQQEPAAIQIEQKGEEVTQNVGKANVEIDGAIKSARAARRKKFWCLLIALIIIIIIVVVVVVVVEVTKK